jgi:hypothetical protein
MWRYLAILLVVGFATTASAEQPSEPDPSLEPRRVIEIQLEALQTNDTPETDAGIERAWAFAHPDNKAQTGPLERFKAMLESPMYRFLIDHRSHAVERVGGTEDKIRFRVRVVADGGRAVAYQWTMAKVGSGEHSGAWMTLQVSPPIEQGDNV